ncbi:MAG: metallophosphoesterase family protein [Panacagrimonas sp.]
MNLTLAHVSDLHLPFEPLLSAMQRFSKRQLSAWSWMRRRALHRSEILDALAADLRAQDLDHIVVTGDITNFSLPGEFRQAASWLQALAPADRISLVPGNHDALVAVADAEGLGRWAAWTRTADTGWPYVHHRADVALIGLNSALPTAPLLARGRLGAGQLSRLEQILRAESEAGRTRVLLLHHPVAEGAVNWRKALADRVELRAVLRRAGAELVLHGHARDARLDALAGPRGPIPCLCVPSSSALPNPRDEGARWHRLTLSRIGGVPRAEVVVRRWSVKEQAFVEDARYDLCLPAPGQGA